MKVAQKMFVMKIPNFSLKHTYNVGQCLRWKELNRGDNGYLIISGNRYVHARQSNSHLHREQIYFDCSEDDFFKYWYFYFDICTDYTQYIHKIDKSDAYLKMCASSSEGTRFINQGMWEAILESVLSDNLSIYNARQKVNSFCSIFSKGVKRTINGVQFTIYPTPRPHEIIKVWNTLEDKPKWNESILQDKAFQKVYYLSLDIEYNDIILKDFVIDKEKRNKAASLLAEQFVLSNETKNRLDFYAFRNKDASPMRKEVFNILEKTNENIKNNIDNILSQTNYQGFKGILIQYIIADN